MTRPYIVTLHRKRKPVGSPRHYSRLDTAFPRCVQRLIQDGQPGDCYEVASADHGFQVGTVTINAKGNVALRFAEEFAA